MIEQIIRRKWKEVKTDEKALRLLYQHYIKVKGGTACCLPVIEQFFLELKRAIKPISETMLTKNYKLSNGSVLFIASRSLHITNANLTDELAQELLKDPRNLKHFQKIAHITTEEFKPIELAIESKPTRTKRPRIKAK